MSFSIFDGSSFLKLHFKKIQSTFEDFMIMVVKASKS